MGFQDKFRQVVPYVAGEQPKMANLIKLNTNENPYPPCTEVAEVLKNFDYEILLKYPNSDGYELQVALADYYKVKQEQVFLGNGSDEVLALIFLGLFNGADPILFPDITYSFYPVYCDLYKLSYKTIPVNEDFTIPFEQFNQKNSGIIFPNPNAPTGILAPLEAIEQVLENNPDSIVVVDEAYIDFGGESALALLDKYENLLITQTFSKSRSLAGIRLGTAIGSPVVIRQLYDIKNSFNSYPIDTIAKEIGVASVKNSDDMLEKCQKIIKTRDNTMARLRELGFQVLDSKANFIFISHGTIPAEELFNALRGVGIIVRHFKADRIENFLRVTIGTDEQMAKFLEFVEDYCNKKGV
ncbi:MAG: histidinol-phosphate transaminase [Erysipelotrichaceae bacterium]|nr:histidinol-phosphate transaminase [Erysipelotrichaceae bacterium]MDD3809675.1 histidinol-phosphate transaminase [Erysipelotrichaceae bacterium]